MIRTNAIHVANIYMISELLECIYYFEISYLFCFPWDSRFRKKIMMPRLTTIPRTKPPIAAPATVPALEPFPAFSGGNTNKPSLVIKDSNLTYSSLSFTVVYVYKIEID